LFPTLAGSVVIPGAAPSLGTEMAEAQSKVDKKTAKYQDHPNKSQQCAIRKFFLPPKFCRLVGGDISPNRWCSFFAKKTKTLSSRPTSRAKMRTDMPRRIRCISAVSDVRYLHQT
jgi:hypothetical protein